MSDANFVKLIRRTVQRDKASKLYHVYEAMSTGEWKPVTRGYAHSTSAYAKLGRITAAESLK